MPTNWLDNLWTYGVGAGIAVIVLWILSLVIRSFLKGIKEDRENYMKIINGQSTTQNNHIRHLEEAIRTQATLVTTNTEKLSHGVEKICDALEAQTEVLKEYIRSQNDNG